MFAMTLGDARDMALQLINRATIAGQSVADTYNNQSDYLKSIPALVNDAQTYIATTAKLIPATYSIVQYPLKNELGSREQQMRMQQHIDTDITYSVPQARAYYFEVFGRAVVTLEDATGVFKTFNITADSGEFTAYKGVMSPVGSVTIRFGGPYTYSLRNVCFYNARFASDDDVPAYRSHITYNMPDDFFQLDGGGIPHVRGESGTYLRTNQYKWIDRTTLMLESALSGEWDVPYYRYPAQITKDSSVDTPLDNVPEAQACVPYYVAARLAYRDDPYLSQDLDNKFELKLSRLQELPRTEVTSTEDIYHCFDTTRGY